MNQAMFDAAIHHIDQMTDDDISDSMANLDIEHECKLKTRYLSFVMVGLPSTLKGIVYPLLTEQLGARWIEVRREWKSSNGAYKQTCTIMIIAVENETAEVMIRLVLPPEVQVTSSDILPNNE